MDVFVDMPVAVMKVMEEDPAAAVEVVHTEVEGICFFNSFGYRRTLSMKCVLRSFIVFSS